MFRNTSCEYTDNPLLAVRTGLGHQYGIQTESFWGLCPRVLQNDSLMGCYNAAPCLLLAPSTELLLKTRVFIHL